MIQAIKKIEHNIGAPLSPRQQEQLTIYCNYLLEQNQKFNLTAIKEESQVWLRHFADSAYGVPHMHGANSILDVGSGGGLPGIVLALLIPNAQVTLLDSNGKKMEFCRQLCERLGITVNIVVGRAEEQKKREAFDIVTARAVAPTGMLLEYLSPLVRVGGKVVLYKGEKERFDAKKTAVLGLDGGKLYPYSLDCECTSDEACADLDIVKQGGQERATVDRRNVICFDKIAHCPLLFPRKNATIRKLPLF